MGQVKQSCTWIPAQIQEFRLEGVHPDWEMHPDWIAGLESLDAYNHWVCEVVMPLAFKWIDEHSDEVFKGLSAAQRDDVGLVVARAFEIVSGSAYYKKGMREFDKLSTALAGGKFNSTRVNPTWQKMSKSLRQARLKAKAQFKAALGPTVREHLKR